MKSRHFQIFVNFMMREGYSFQNAIDEFDFIVKADSTWENYKKAIRLGSNLCLDRKTRQNIFSTFLNAEKHAAYEEYLAVKNG